MKFDQSMSNYKTKVFFFNILQKRRAYFTELCHYHWQEISS